MARRPKLTEAEIAKIGELRYRNWTQSAIAEAVGCSQGSVFWCCLKHGFEPRKTRPLPPHTPVQYQRASGPVRQFTPEEDAVLLELEAGGVSRAEIARRLGRRDNTIAGRLMTLARRAERQEAA